VDKLDLLTGVEEKGSLNSHIFAKLSGEKTLIEGNIEGIIIFGRMVANDSPPALMQLGS
jgi:hypothetical protein